MKNISQALRKEHSKRLTIRIGDYIGEDAIRFKEIVKLVLSGDPLIAQRASWVLGTHGEKFPHLFLPHLSELIPITGIECMV